MAGNPQVLGLLEEMLDSGKTPEEVCCRCPELLPEVRQRWQEFQLIDAQVRTFLPGLATRSNAGAGAPPATGLPEVPGYEVEAVLGRGGMGVVYKARHLALKRTVALKMLAAGHSQPAVRARFSAEAQAVARLQHPNIVQIHEIGEADGRPFFALEYVAGGSLAQRLAGQPLPPHDSARLVAALAEAMHLAHSRNLVHRDLKPANVLLVGESNAPVGQCRPKVTDFGLVRQLDADSGQTFDGVVMGTAGYMAPEQADGRAHAAGPAADVYALGAILYECLTGRPPFGGETPLETLEQVRSREPAAPSSLNRQAPRDLETICLKCLRKEPERRYSSAQELADDLGRFVRGEPVAARPVGRLEKLAKWIRRNPTVACLSAVAALALVAGTMVSLLFGIEARRKADDLEQQTFQLQAQTRAAQENARLAEENEKEVGLVLVAGLLIPIGRNPHPLTHQPDAGEADALRQLRTAPAPLRLQFLETALRDPETARRVGRRADWVVQAIVGGDRALRADVARLVVQRIQEPGAPQEVMLACARLGLAVNLADPAWAEHSADALLVALREPLIDPLVERDHYPPLAEALAAVSERLPPTQAADRVARALDVFLTRMRDPVGQLSYQQLGQSIVAISPGLDAAAAARAAEALGAVIRRTASGPLIWESASRALVAVSRRLPPADSAAYVNETVDFILATRSTTKEKERYSWTFHAQALGALSGRLDTARAARVAEALIAFLGDSETVGGVKREFIASGGVIAKALTEVAERLDAQGGLRAAEELVLLLRKAGRIIVSTEQLRTALAAVCRRLDAAGAAHVSGAIDTAVRDPKTSAEVRTLFADAVVAVGVQIDPAQRASLESALVDSLVANLADAKADYLRRFLAQALATVCGRPGATDAARAAKALAAAIHDPQTHLTTLKPLAEALAVVSARLPPKEATSHAMEAVDVLDSLWVAKPTPPDRASIAEALAVVWTRLDAGDAAARAKRVAAELEDALRIPKTAPNEIGGLAPALSAVYNHFDPAERSARANVVADAVLTALRKSRENDWKVFYLSEALAGLFAHLDRSSTVRVTDAVFTVLGGPNILQLRFDNQEKLFKEISARLDARDLFRLLDHPMAAGRVQRVLLDSLAGSKNRSFRNTWEYLDSIEESHRNETDVPAEGTNQ